MVRKFLFFMLMFMCSWETYAQETLNIHTKGGITKSIPFSKKPELYFDKTNTIKVVIAGYSEEYPYKDIKQITFENNVPVAPRGDLNADGEIDVTDVVELIDMVLAGSTDPAGDINGDGEVDVTDVVELIDIVLAN